MKASRTPVSYTHLDVYKRQPIHKNIAAETKPCEIICMSPPSMPSALPCLPTKRKKPSVTKPICEIDEYATSFFMSVWMSATKPMYTIAMSEIVTINGASRIDASGTMGRMKRKKPYAPSFKAVSYTHLDVYKRQRQTRIAHA